MFRKKINSQNNNIDMQKVYIRNRIIFLIFILVIIFFIAFMFMQSFKRSRILEETKYGKLVFQKNDSFPKEWGKIRYVTPDLAVINDVESSASDNMLGALNSEAVVGYIEITGKVIGKPQIGFISSPDKGVKIKVAGVITKDGIDKWMDEDDLGYLKANETKEFYLSNYPFNTVLSYDELIIIAYSEGGMPEDKTANVDKCVFGIYRVNLKVLNIFTNF
jgi:hypothetical protein